MTAIEKLLQKNSENKFICVGLDTDIDKIPAHLRSSSDPILNFNAEIIKYTSPRAASFKLNFAFYEKYGSEGFRIMKETISLIPPDLLVIGDAKRGDIGNTSMKYAESIFGSFGCDASTLNPYMGEDSLKPFLEFREKLNFILVLTSNPGASDFQKLKLAGGTYLYQEVIRKIKSWNTWSNCGIVFGATKPEELRENIADFNQIPVLLPGVGAQGGSLGEVISIFNGSKKKDFLINISRGIIYKSGGKDFADAAANEIEMLNASAKNLMK